MINLEGLSVEAACHVAYFYDAREGYRPGSFVSQLIKAIASADPENRALLRLGFPAYVDAMTACSDEPGGLVRVIEIARNDG